MISSRLQRLPCASLRNSRRPHTTTAAASPPLHVRRKRDCGTVQEPRYTEIKRIVSHDPQNWLYPWAISDTIAGSRQRECYRYLLNSLRHCPSQQSWRVLEEMRRCGLSLSHSELSLFLLRTAQNDNLELALRYLHLLRLICDIAEWFELSSDVKLSKGVWVSCLAASAGNLYPDGLEASWARILAFPNPSITRGLQTIVLQAAKRLKLAELTAEAVEALCHDG
ncbi:hypothetical protein NMY22_g10316 [Coprinellus aureogranulatus]|nr:hypothetical protein NMY22_g10316 [Coprinellus aureogranulatus]